MVTVYIVRHCEALGNLARVFQGGVDYDITETGAKQLECLAKRFENINIDKVYSSPLIRAQKTAKAVADPKGLPIILDERLRELHFGDFENTPYDDFKSLHAEYADKWLNSPWEFESPNGEKMPELYERIWEAFKDIIKENEGKVLLLASHGCAIRNLLCHAVHNDIMCLADVPLGSNTAVTKLTVHNEMQVAVEYYSDVSHLPQELLHKSNVLNKTGENK